jgi:hypothetical protein
MNILPMVLMLYSWGGIGVLIVILYRIGRFYQVTSGRRAHYQWFVVPLALLFLGALRYALQAVFVGDALGDSLMLIGGLALITLCSFLLKLMTGSRS